MIHGLAYTHYWYAPYFIDPYFIDLWTATSVHLEAIVAHQMLEDFLILSMLILLLMIACCWTVSRWFTYGQQWTFRIMTHYHHYHHYYHRDDGATGKVHYRTFNVWGNHGSYAKYCDNVMVTYMEKYCDTKILWHCHWVPWYVFIITSPLPYLVLVFLVLITACSIKSQYFL